MEIDAEGLRERACRQQRAGRPFPRGFALPQEENPVREKGGKSDVMGCEDNGPATGGERGKFLRHPPCIGGVQERARFVKKEGIRALGKAAGYARKLEFAPGNRIHGPLPERFDSQFPDRSPRGFLLGP